MKKAVVPSALVCLLLFSACFSYCGDRTCMTGAFLSDRPTAGEIKAFKRDYGKKPAMVMVFVNWGDVIDRRVLREVHSQKCALFVTLEPWDQITKKGIDYKGLVAGKYDKYISAVAMQVKSLRRPVFVRFAHEMNGNWYPWSGSAIGAELYVAAYRRVKDVFDRAGASNAVWVFSVNWEDVPGGPANDFRKYYPGDAYVDIIGIDGYNWGDTQAWARWREFDELFAARVKESGEFGKPVIISEFGSTSSGGDRASWIAGAMDGMKRLGIKGFVLFNVDKETDWRFRPGSPEAKILKEKLKDNYFSDSYRVPE